MLEVYWEHSQISKMKVYCENSERFQKRIQNPVEHHRSLKAASRCLAGLWICLCMNLVQQFWRWRNEISKVSYKETLKKARNLFCLSSEWLFEWFRKFSKKTPTHVEIFFWNKIASYLTVPGKLWNFQNSFVKKQPKMAAFAIGWKVSIKVYLQKKRLE